MSKLGNFVVKHHTGVTRAMTGVSAILLGAMVANIVDLNRSDAILTRDEQWKKQINKAADEWRKEHPEDSEETGA